MPQEFYPFNLYQRYNGVFFIKNTGRKHMENKEVTFQELSHLYLLNIKRRENKMEEIQERIQRANFSRSTQ